MVNAPDISFLTPILTFKFSSKSSNWDEIFGFCNSGIGSRDEIYVGSARLVGRGAFPVKISEVLNGSL